MSEKKAAPINLAVTLRPAGPGDAVACAGILNDWIDATEWMPRIDRPEAVVKHYRETVLPEQRVWMAEAGGAVRGFLALDDARMITALYVAAGWRGRGVGCALLTMAKAQGGPLWLWTFEANRAAQAFYERAGFHAVRRTPGDNEESLPDIFYQWEGAV